MSNLATKFTRLKRSLGGNREKTGFEYTFGMPVEEEHYLTPPNRETTRLLSELEFAMRLSGAEEKKYDSLLDEVLEYLLAAVKEDGTLTKAHCAKAEEMLAPMGKDAKEYQLILAAHAHIDMNWMWSFNETVAATLATFRTMLNLMDQYPDFCFSQSQASVYQIVEEYDPELMERIKARIAEGRWEVTASGWVETDKNMPNTESLLRHIQYTREYLSEKWGVKNFAIDFSPDTFGHNGNVPEIDCFGDVKYFYHCRALDGDYVLYRYRAPSGREVLAYREPYWYNSAITPHIGPGLIDLSRRSGGLKTGLIVYGVGDHGGGPTRRDVERALDMMTWPIYPKIKFGTLLEFFQAAESVREKLPVVDHELEYFAPGCYTTQSRIKRGNRRLEAALCDAESYASLANGLASFQFRKGAFRKAWQDVLFTHFHDIITGSCVQDTREHAMGLYQTSMAAASTQAQNALRVIAENIDTSSIPVDIDAYNTQSEGAGAGYGLENFVGVPSPERGSGRTRIFHVFNPLAQARTEMVELTVWDWTGDMREIQMKDAKGNPLPFQLLDKKLEKYWDHRYFRVLAEVTVPAWGYTTIVLSEADPEEYRFYYHPFKRTSRDFPDFVLENDQVAVCINSNDGRIASILDKKTGTELIQPGKSAGLTCIETECASSSAWNIGRHLSEAPVDRCLEVRKVVDGQLRSAVKATYTVMSSTAEVTYTLDRNQRGVQVDLKVDWKEIGGQTVPVLDYRLPLAYEAKDYLYDIPAGSIVRPEVADDVPALQYGAALNEKGASAVLISDSKYGYRGQHNALALTLINSSTSPDPYPERGIHHVKLFAGVTDGCPKATEELACRFNHPLAYQAGNCRKGTLPLELGMLSLEAGTSVLSAVTMADDGAVVVRLYETSGKDDAVTLHFGADVKSAASVNLLEQENGREVKVSGGDVSFTVPARSLFEVKVQR